MRIPVWFTLLISFLSDFIIAAGGTLTGAMLGQQSIAVPTAGVWILALVVGAVAGARRLQALVAPALTGPPPNGGSAVLKTVLLLLGLGALVTGCFPMIPAH